MLETSDVFLRLLAAAAAGAVLGWERQARHKPAGLRTHMLVTLGAAIFMIAGVELHEQLRAADDSPQADILKLIAGIAGGVGFLGAGAILHSRGSVKGLTTAATIWVSAAIGVAAGLGQFTLVTASVAFALVILVSLAWIEWWAPRVAAAPSGASTGNYETAESASD